MKSVNKRTAAPKPARELPAKTRKAQRELGSERIREKILLAPSGSLALSAISAAEIWRGIGQSRHSKAANLNELGYGG